MMNKNEVSEYILEARIVIRADLDRIHQIRDDLASSVVTIPEVLIAKYAVLSKVEKKRVIIK